MNTKKKVLLGVLAVIVIVVGIIFFVPMFNGSKDAAKTTPTSAPSVADNTPTATPQPTVDNSATSGSLQTPPEMQAVIDANQADLYGNEDGQLAQSYPSNLLPLYKVSGVGDSHDITTNNGNPGWTAVYGSTADTAELAQFYSDLMASAENFNAAGSDASTTITGTVDGCDISVTISPNNPQRTGLDYASSVSIFIEKVS